MHASDQKLIFVTQFHEIEEGSAELWSIILIENRESTRHGAVKLCWKGNVVTLLKCFFNMNEAQHETFLSIGSQPWLRCVFHACNLIIVIDSVRCGFYRTLKAVVNGYNQSI